MADVSSKHEYLSAATPSEASRAIFVIGMHRSGTSALTRVLNLLGVDLGHRLIPPDASNTSGYWEHIDLVDLNDRMLRGVGSRWDSLCDLPQNWQQATLFEPFRQEFITRISREIAEARLWGAKDPRLSRVLPLWIPVLNSLNVVSGCVHIFRHPAAVVASLRKRDIFTVEKAYFLWLRYVLDAERNSRQLPRVAISYEDLTTDWEQVCGRISKALDCQWPTATAAAAIQISQFLACGQNRIPPEDRYLVGHPTLEELVGLTHSALCQHQFQDDFKIRQFFDLLRDRLNQLTSRFQPNAREIRNASVRGETAALKHFRERASLMLLDLPGVQEQLRIRHAEAKKAATLSVFNSFTWLVSRHLSCFRSWAAPDDTRRGAFVRLAILAGRTYKKDGLRQFLIFVGNRILNHLRPAPQTSEVSPTYSGS